MGLVVLLALGAAACSSATTSSGSSGTAPRASAYSLDVAAQRQAYTTNPKSPVIHDTETNALVVAGQSTSLRRPTSGSIPVPMPTARCW